MTIVAFGLTVVSMLMLAAAFAVPISRRLGLPAPVLFAAIGLVHGVAMALAGGNVFEGALDSYDQWFVAQLARDSQLLLYLFLPPLLFEMALAVNVRRLLDDAAAVVVMAIFAVAIATALIGGALWLATPVTFAMCLLLGAAVATTDPGAVISTFREIGAPRRLLVILEGESLLNDAAAIAIFGLIIAILTDTTEPTAIGIVGGFIYSFAAGAAVGLGAAAVGALIYPMLARSSVAEASVTIAIAYLSYIVAELAAGGSGVVAVVFAGLATGSTGYMRMGPGNWQTVRTVWSQIGFWANALILIVATSLAPALIRDAGWLIVPAAIVVYVAATAARAAILMLLLPGLAAMGLTAPLTRPQTYLLTWGGVRGSVTLVLAISIADLSILGEDARLLAATAATYTLMTVFINAGSLAWLTRRLGLDKLSAGDLALRDRIVAGALSRVQEVVRNLVGARHLESDALAVIEADLAARQEAAAAERAQENQRIEFGERLRMGLKILAGQEARLIRRGFEEGAFGPRAASALRLDAERISDGARVGGREGYRVAAFDAIQPGGFYRLGVLARRLFRIDRPLRMAMELHFITLLESERVTRELRSFVQSMLPPMIGDDAARNLELLMAERRDAINAEIDAIASQYPEHARAVEEILVARAAVRRERQQYDRLLNDGVIASELYDSLMADLDKRENAVAGPPRVDLALTPAELLERVPVFASLDQKQRRRVARILRARFTAPGEVLRNVGDRGSEMYFIASGACEIIRGETITRLGTGDFFGQSALSQPLRRRRSSVRSLGYCRLLVLTRRDFKRLVARHPDLETVIREATEAG